jgi:hypothetical protein
MNADYIAFMFFVWISDQTVTFALYIINSLAFITDMESVYRAVRTESLYNKDISRILKVNKCSILHPIGINISVFYSTTKASDGEKRLF